LRDGALHFDQGFRAKIDCRKSEIRLNLAYEHSCPASCQDGPHRSVAFKAPMGPRNKIRDLFRATPSKVLIRTTESKEIQINPTLVSGDFCSKTVRAKKIQLNGPSLRRQPPQINT
jgi:hypothetical protein